MAKRLDKALDRFWHRGALRRWMRIAEGAEGLELEPLRALRARAWTMRRQLDRVLHVAEGRLALPVIGSNAVPRPMGTDWAWRPALWRGKIAVPGLASAPARAVVAEGTTLFHDCRVSEVTLRQVRNQRETDLAPFGLRIDVFRFDGSFLSLVIDLPEEAARGLKLRHLLRMTAIVETEKPLEIFARLNIRHGPNQEQIVRELPLGADEVMVEFDLAYTRMNEKRVDKVWVDLIFEGPEMNQITLRDLTFTRRPRADL